MNDYTERDLLRIARRYRNAKRSYLMVDPLQAKHMPVRPSAALAMMRTLGRRVRDREPGMTAVIGFSETATAIGAAVAAAYGPDCVYRTTTRESFPEGRKWLDFLEEHSHATEQRLCTDRLNSSLARGGRLLLVDDELSTGKTLRNMSAQLRRALPALGEARIIAAAVIDRLSPENRALLEDAGIRCRSLLHLHEEDYTARAEAYEVMAPEDLTAAALPAPVYTVLTPETPLPDPRTGVRIGDYRAACKAAAAPVAERLQADLPSGARILALGTEECMYPALIAGKALEALGFDVRSHATTRSPIGICPAEDYPIREGYRIPSFYETDRDTFLYDPEPYGAVVVVTDSPADPAIAMAALAEIFRRHGSPRLYLLRGGR